MKLEFSFLLIIDIRFAFIFINRSINICLQIYVYILPIKGSLLYCPGTVILRVQQRKKKGS